MVMMSGVAKTWDNALKRILRNYQDAGLNMRAVDYVDIDRNQTVIVKLKKSVLAPRRLEVSA